MKPNLTIGGIMVRHLVGVYLVIIGVLLQFFPLVFFGIITFYMAIIGYDPVKDMIEDWKIHRKKRLAAKARNQYAELIQQLRREGVIRLRWENEGQEGPAHAH